MGHKKTMSEEYSEGQLRLVLATVDEWHEAFAESPRFARLDDSQQRKAGAITEFFARYSYEYLGLSPAQWDRSAVVECCREVLPRKVSAELSFFEAVVPVLSAFFSFLEDQSLLPDGYALAEAVEELHDEIAVNAADRSNWGPAKHFVMTAHDAGMDISDPAALQAYMLEFNLQQLARSEFASATRSPWPAVNALLPKQQTTGPPVGPYDPCPCGSGRKYRFCCKQKG